MVEWDARQVCLLSRQLVDVGWMEPDRSRDAKSEEHEERAPAIFPPAVLIFGLPTQKYAKIC